MHLESALETGFREYGCHSIAAVDVAVVVAVLLVLVL